MRRLWTVAWSLSVIRSISILLEQISIQAAGRYIHNGLTCESYLLLSTLLTGDSVGPSYIHHQPPHPLWFPGCSCRWQLDAGLHFTLWWSLVRWRWWRVMTVPGWATVGRPALLPNMQHLGNIIIRPHSISEPYNLYKSLNTFIFGDISFMTFFQRIKNSRKVTFSPFKR